MFCAVEEDKMISGTEHTITETNKTKFKHTSGCHGLQTGRQPIVSLLQYKCFGCPPGYLPYHPIFRETLLFIVRKLCKL